MRSFSVLYQDFSQKLKTLKTFIAYSPSRQPMLANWFELDATLVTEENGQRIVRHKLQPEQYVDDEISLRQQKREASMSEQNISENAQPSLASAAEPLCTRVYLFQPNPIRRKEYFKYYKEKILPWLKRKGVKEAKVWTVERDDVFIFAITASPEDPPWNDPEIPEVQGFLDVLSELKLTPRPDLGISPNIY
jgi:hypothetical protein